MASKDHWDSKNYDKAASFVPRLTTTVVKYLDAQRNENILDLGCGDGVLTVEIAKVVTEGKVLGLDFSASMIQSAQKLASHANLSNCSFGVENCATFSSPEGASILDGSWDKVFSNAAYHWILRQPETRVQALEAPFKALKPGGKFVFECGGMGNVAELKTALIAALVAHDVPLQQACEMIPWYFASEDWFRKTLEDIGFVVDKLELEYRPTKLTVKDEHGRGGLEGWLRLFGASILEGQAKSDEIVRYACGLLESVVTKEDGSQWVGYVRLRGIATKPLNQDGV